jgi:mono/diheme cytochrome c family protein
MPSYAAELTPEERWGVVAYLRALQLSQHAAVDQLPARTRARLEGEGR